MEKNQILNTKEHYNVSKKEGMSECSWQPRKDTQGFVPGPTGEGVSALALSTMSKAFPLTRLVTLGPEDRGTLPHVSQGSNACGSIISLFIRGVLVCLVDRTANKKWKCLRGRIKQSWQSQGGSSLFSVPRLKSCREIASGNSLYLWAGLKWSHPWPSSQRAKPSTCVLHVFFLWTLPAGFVRGTRDELVRAHLLLWISWVDSVPRVLGKDVTP